MNMPTLPGFSAPLLLGTVLAFFLSWLISAIISYRSLRHIPGPRLWAWSRLPLIRVHVIGDSYHGFGAISEQYGELARIGPNHVLSSDPDIIRRLNAPRSPYTKSNWYLASRFTPGVDNMISDRDDKRHEIMRRKVAPVYAGKSNPDLERDIDECILELVQLIDDRYLTIDKAKVVKMELARKVQYLTTDVISKLSFSGKFHDLRDDNDNMGYINEIESLFPKVFCTSVMPELIELLTKTGILKLLNPLNSTKMAFGKVMAITRTQIESRFGSDGKPVGPYGDMLGGFIKAGLTRQEMEQEAIVQLAAGSDTSASAMRATMLGLMNTPKACQKLLIEIDNAAQAQKIPPVGVAVISDAQAKELPYLQAVIKEGMRWYPPIGGLLAKKVPKGGDTINGYYVPGGTLVGYSAKAIHHSTALFGPDPYEFRPERWLHTSQGGDEPSWDKIRAMERNNDLIFGHGKYQCLGKGIAFMELNKFFVELLRRFDFTLLDPENPWQTVCYGIHLQKGLWVSVKRRGE